MKIENPNFLTHIFELNDIKYKNIKYKKLTAFFFIFPKNWPDPLDETGQFNAKAMFDGLHNAPYIHYIAIHQNFWKIINPKLTEKKSIKVRK